MAAPSLSFTNTATGQGRNLSKTNAHTASQSISIEETVADSTTDFQVNVAIDVSTIKAIIINSTQNVTLETNSGGAPAETIALLANVPLMWDENSYYANLLGTDIVALFFTNASGGVATVNIECVYDATP